MAPNSSDQCDNPQKAEAVTEKGCHEVDRPQSSLSMQKSSNEEPEEESGRDQVAPGIFLRFW